MQIEPEYINIDDVFTFSCTSNAPCFNQCCCDVNQFLYPYEIIRLKTALGITSTEFLDTYCLIYTGETTGLPVVSFMTVPTNNHACPLVTESGCSVYENRPASCRIFPLARALSRSRETGAVSEHFALIKDPVCKGFNTDTTTSVRAFLSDQGLDEYNRHNDRMIELISLKHQILPDPLFGQQKEDFILGLYDLDRFRAEILSNGLLTETDLGPSVYQNIQTDDVALLDVGLNWVRRQLFGNK